MICVSHALPPLQPRPRSQCQIDGRVEVSTQTGHQADFRLRARACGRARVTTLMRARATNIEISVVIKVEVGNLWAKYVDIFFFWFCSPSPHRIRIVSKKK